MRPARPRRARACAALLVVPLLLGACAARGPRPAPPPRETGQLLLWEVQSAAHPRARAFLLGSVHAASPDLVFDPAIDRAFEAADVLVIETDITSQSGDPFAFMQRTIQMAVLPGGQTLDQVLPKPTWDRLGEFQRARGQPVELYRRYEPWLLVTMVTAYVFAEAGLPPEGGVDIRLTRRAEGRMPIVALETPEFQLGLLDGLPLAVQARVLGDLLEQQDAVRAQATRLYDAWRLGDDAAIERETAVDADESPEMRVFHEKVFVARNQTMAQRIDALLREDRTYFVVVGAGHVVGEQGVPALLARSGHRVLRVPKTQAGAQAPAPARAPAGAPAPVPAAR
jgi:uncharacterized protein YbaP (TraB family)